jgi:hypothetical protein
MKPEKIVLAIAAALFAAGFGTWIVGGAQLMSSVGIWLWLAGVGVMGLPLLLLVIDAIVKAVRRQ